MVLLVGGLFCSCTEPAPAGPPPPVIPPDSVVTVAAGPQYMRGPVHRFFWGGHYREVWSKPVRVPVVSLRNLVPGGLTPIEAGGSFQTKNLRLVDQSGRQFVLRSVDKDPTKALPENLQAGAIGRLMKDQTSVIQPYGAYIVPVLAQAAGVYHTNPRLVYVGDDGGLGAFQKDYANALYLLEERPEGDQSTVASFGRSAKVESSRKVFTNLLFKADHRVEATQYLRARLFDMFLGDWSRREDQWRWASFGTPAGGVRYEAIPRDRDHAFFKFDDGVFTRIISWVKSNYQSFHEEIRLGDVEGLNRAARPMDKSLLVYLSATDFRQVADSLKRRLSDQVIEEAIAAWPAEIQTLSAAEFRRKLRSRRDQLPAVAAKFYELLAQDVEVPGTDQPERFVLEAAGPAQLRLSVYQRNTTRADSLIGQRTFLARDTRSVKLFGLGGNDQFNLVNLPETRIAISIYDGAGQDGVLVVGKLPARPNVTVYNCGDGNIITLPKSIKVEAYQPKAEEFDAAGWLLRHRLY
ncbi:hypothetical protein FY528_18470 [Hymenobacter lutimineralis]|uniref:Uncharacterized protein n=1 Tax=Hymenobacter lutimineralis TaxID=2606448 RepID=A0A5D6UTB5_9BACT|nr:hypothetical protein [Hymenobacter lutimineralis]TYZ06357.1 hypothetical protein FY528_18470 [Hymenobacter lutimineralis]